MFRVMVGTMLVLVVSIVSGCAEPAGKIASPAPATSSGSGGEPTLAEARRGFATKIVHRDPAGDPLPEPPPQLFQRVTYRSAVGQLGAYVSPPPGDGKKHPAIIWITGGDYNTIDGGIWQPQEADNDQSASAFREAGIIMMYPSLRGGNDNPGAREGFFGEVDDVLAAADYLAALDYVDPQRIYLGGHSTGGTLVLLVGEFTPRFRAVFSFGAAEDIRGYGPEMMPFDASDPEELLLRNPLRWRTSIRSPVFVFEGADQPGNLDSLDALAVGNPNPLLQCHPIRGHNHFSLLQPMTRLLARRILADVGAEFGGFTSEELTLGH